MRSAYQAEASGQLRVCRASQSLSLKLSLPNKPEVKTEKCDIKSPGLCFMLYLKFILSINVAFKMRSVVFHLSVTPSNSGVCAGFQQHLKSFIS